MDDESEQDKSKKDKILDEDFFKQDPQYLKKPQKIVKDNVEDTLYKIRSLNNEALINLFTCFDLETLIKFLKVNKTLNKIVLKSETLQKLLDIVNKGKPNEKLNFLKIYSVSTLLKNNCELFAKFQKKV